VITYRYQELSEAGVPRFPSFVGVREDQPRGRSAKVPTLPFARKGAETVKTSTASSARRFELSEGTANKFWEVSRDGTDVTVRFGRIGTQGQTNVKSFSDAGAAAQHVEKLIREKSGKGYTEIG
jgi:DNA ligase-1